MLLLRVLLFFAGQLLLLLGGGWVCWKLRASERLVTVWGFTAVSWYLYLLIWYGPTSLFVILGKDYVMEAQSHPWWLREDMLVPALLNAMVLQVMPLLITVVLLRRSWPAAFNPWRRLEPLLAHPVNLWFGLLGTAAQVLSAALYGHSWLASAFDFSVLPLWQKAAMAGFLMFTIAPQLSLMAYGQWRRGGVLTSRQLAVIILLSIGLAIWSFLAFGQRTYVMFEVVCLLVVLYRFLELSPRLILIALPLLLFGGYALTSLQVRVQQQETPLQTAVVVGKRLVDDLAYRSGIANDSVVLGARSCVRNQLSDEGTSPLVLLPMELLSGFPAPIRDAINPRLGDQRLEPRIGACYRIWLGQPELRPDLSDSKIEYFLVALSPWVAGLVGSVIWLAIATGFLTVLTLLFERGLTSIAFVLPASTHLLTLSTTPGEFFVFAKAALPYVVVISIVRSLQRIPGFIGR